VVYGSGLSYRPAWLQQGQYDNPAIVDYIPQLGIVNLATGEAKHWLSFYQFLYHAKKLEAQDK
jgi:hypothetical protein